MNDTLDSFKAEVARVYRLATDTVDVGGRVVYLDEDGSDIMMTTTNEDNSQTFDFLMSDRHFNVYKGVVNEL